MLFFFFTLHDFKLKTLSSIEENVVGGNAVHLSHSVTRGQISCTNIILGGCFSSLVIKDEGSLTSVGDWIFPMPMTLVVLTRFCG